ncbi:amino acid adenylation domain-containing protein [Nocardia sp. 004]|uniref:amino acid adenylation domain-containing protein n=1 Tax=Nocardia sp. 004 TaxID=3385978 RepID=UPI00399F5131
MQQPFVPSADIGTGLPRAAFPLSAAQRGIWFAQHIAGDIPISIAQYIDLTGPIDLDLLAPAARRAGREFGTGYLRLIETDGPPYQCVDTTLDDSVPIVDLRDELDPEAAAHAWMRAEYSAPLDLMRDRLICVVLLRIADDRWFWYWRIHHIALDGTGVLTMARRAGELYTAALEGRQPPAGHAEDLRRIVDADLAYRSSDRFLADREYWLRHLAGMADPVSLAGRSAEVDAHPSRVEGILTRDTAELLTTVAKATSFGVAPTVVAAFGAYLAAMTGATEVVLSLPVSARTTAAMRRSGGMVANVVPLRLTLDPAGTVGAMISAARSELTGALRRQRYRQEDILRDLGKPMDEFTSFGPSVNLLLVDTGVRLGAATGRAHVLTAGPIEDLYVNLYSEPGAVRHTHIDFQGNANLYSDTELTAHHNRFLRFLHRFLAAGTDTALARIPVVSDAELAELVPARGAADVAPRTLPEILTTGADLDPEAIAVRSGATGLSYRWSGEYTNRLARLLIASGAGPEHRVAISIPRSAQSQLALLAVAKTGAAFVPIDPAYPADRIEYLVDDSGAELGITVAAARKALPDHVHWLVLDEEATERSVAEQSAAPIDDTARRATVRLDQVAYLIYTSGSTGPPKGVSVTHRGLTNMVASSVHSFGLDTDSVLAHAVSPSFDISVGDIVVTVAAGATLAVIPPATYAGEELAEALRAHHATHLDATPAVVRSLDPATLPDLRTVVVGGDICPAELATLWSGRALLNGYGPTETTVTATLSDALSPDAPVTIGSPIRGVRAVVLDSWLRPVAPGAIGELYLAGVCLARGYHRRPGLTASRFVANPYADGARMYRTGDLVRWTVSSGRLVLEFLGRSDFQVKVRGFRIELGEIDTVLQRHPDIDFAVTRGVRTASGATVLASYVLPRPGATVHPEALEAVAGATLPAYMVPAAIVVLDSIPLTPLGKVDRKALPEPVFGTGARNSRPPSRPHEETLVALFAEVLGLASVGVDESFFALGGDSILSIQLVSRARAAGIGLRARDVFERKTVAALAAVATEVHTLVPELPGGGVGTVALTPIVHTMLDQGDTWRRFGQAVVLGLPPGIDRARLVAAVQALLDHHDLLRCSLRRTERGWVWVVAEPGSVAADTLVDVVPSGPDANRTSEYELQRAADLLDPEAGVVVRVVLIERADSGPLCLLVLHHLVTDGISWRILLPDLATAATGGVLAPVGTSFRRWADGQFEHAAGRIGELPVWQHILAVPDPPIGMTTLDPDIDTVATGAVRQRTIAPDVADTILTTVPDRFHCGADEVLLTGLAMAVCRWRHRRTCLCALEGHGRSEAILPGADIARTVGWFTSVYPVAVDLTGIDLDDAFAGGPSAGAALEATEQQLRAIPDKGIGFGMLRYLNPETGAVFADAQAPQLSFNYLGRAPTGDTTEPWLPQRFAAIQDTRAPLPAVLDINAVRTATGLEVTWTYASRLLDAAEVDELAALWAAALRALADHAGTPDAGGYTPCDFELVTVTQPQIDIWERDYPNLLDVWPLTPLQYGLFFHARYDPGAADGYTEQSMFTLAGTVDAARLRTAAQTLLARHDNLRVAFVETGDGPRQLVLTDVDIAWQEIDLTEIAEAEQRQRELDRVTAAEACTRFDLTRPPLMRCTLVRTAADRYRFVLTNHHLVLDGWSTPLLMRELLALYVSAGDVSVLPPAHSYREFLSWLRGQDQAASTAVWAGYLDGIESPTLVCPAATGAGPIETGTVSIDLPWETTDRMETTARDFGITVNTMVQAGWAMVVALLTGRTDVVFGTTVSGRPPELADVEDMVGLFINTLPVRVRFDPAEQVADLLARLHSAHARLMDHQHIGLTAIHKAVGRTELFDTLTVFESYPIDREALTQALDIAGLQVLDIAGIDATPYPLNLMVVPLRDSTGHNTLRLTLKFRTGQFAPTAARPLLDRFHRLLAQLAADPHARVSQLQYCDAVERAALLPVRGPDPVPPRLLPELLGAGARIDPDAIAVSAGERRMSYRELDAWSNRLARVLLRRGAGREMCVGLALPRSPEAVVTVWALAKTGAAFMPLDTHFPIGRLEYILTDSKARIGVTMAVNRAMLPDTLDWLLLDDTDTVHEVMSATDAPITDTERDGPVHIDQAAYLMYTSGSTGMPKAVLLSHRGLANLVTAQQESLVLDPTARILHVAAPSFDASVFELLAAHGTGSCLVIAPPEVYGGADLHRLLRTARITHAAVTPSVLATMEPTGLDHLRVLAVGGEATTADLIQRWSPGRRIANLYGPTEFSTWATSREDFRAGEPITIGRPIRGTVCMVLDPWLRPVPVGVTGELYLAGPALARGYRNQSGMTAGRFVAAPYGEPGERMYRTGDMVRWVTGRDGACELEYLNRSDFQVKIRGMRIELGEIDTVLSREEDVGYAVTIGRTGPTGTTMLVSYIRPAEGAELDIAHLRAVAAAALPAYMVPAAFVVLDTIPLNAVGKLDRAALPTPEFTAERPPYRAPETPAEETLAAVYAELLGRDEVGADDCFFALGGDSITALQLVSRAAQRGIHRTPQQVFRYRTVAELAAATGTAPDGPEFDILLPIRLGGSEPALFCIHPSAGIAWTYAGFAEALAPGRPIYGLQAPELSGHEPSAHSIEDLADQYLREMRTVQPAGPYHLLGWSFGGLIAHAIAAKLAEAGDTVGMLALLDTDSADIDDAGVEQLTAGGFVNAFSSTLGVGEVPTEASAKEAAELIRAQLGEVSLINGNTIERMTRSYNTMARYRSGYRRPVFDGDMVYFSATVDTADSCGPVGWQPYVAGNIINHDIAVTHDELTAPHVLPLIARVLEEHLRDGESRRTGAEGGGF